MSKAVKVILIVFGILFFLTIICGGFAYIGSKLPSTASLPTQTTIPTQEPLPTYTPMPTYTPYPTTVPPTPVPPTAVPTEVPVVKSQPLGGGTYDPSMYRGSGPTLIDCPSSNNTPAIVSYRECYKVSTNSFGILYFDSNGDLLAISIAMLIGDTNSAYDAGIFAGQTAVMYGWSLDDLSGVMDKIQNPDTTYVYGSIKAQASQSSDGTMIFIIFMPVNSNFQGL